MILIVSFIACILPVFYFELPQPLKLIPYAPVIWLHKTAGMGFLSLIIGLIAAVGTAVAVTVSGKMKKLKK